MTEVLPSALLASISILVARRWAGQLGLVARVVLDRWHRKSEVPLVGGIGLLLGVLPWLELWLGVIVAGFFVVGLVDDLRGLSPFTKAVLIAVPSIAAAWWTGHFWVGIACWWGANSVNLLDHADGLAAACALGSVAVAGGPASLAAAGACSGFLLYNFPPARVFLGNSGSHMLGALVVLTWSKFGPVATLVGIAVPSADMIFVTLRRLGERRKPWVGGTDHSGHVLLRAGIQPGWLAVSYGLVAGGLCLVARVWER